MVTLCQIPSKTQLETAFQCQMFDGIYTLIQKTGILCNIPSTDTMRQRTNVTRSWTRSKIYFRAIIKTDYSIYREKRWIRSKILDSLMAWLGEKARQNSAELKLTRP